MNEYFLTIDSEKNPWEDSTGEEVELHPVITFQ